jgi:hypothetical protein
MAKVQWGNSSGDGSGDGSGNGSGDGNGRREGNSVREGNETSMRDGDVDSNDNDDGEEQELFRW